MNKKLIFSFFVGFLFWLNCAYGSQAEMYFNKGMEYFMVENYKDAQLNFSKAVEADPDFFSAYSALAISYINLKEYKNAINILEKAIELEIEEPITYYMLGMAYESLKKYKKAIGAWEKYIVLEKKDKKRIKMAKKHLRHLRKETQE